LKEELYYLLNSAYNMSNIRERIYEIIKEMEYRKIIDEEI